MLTIELDMLQYLKIQNWWAIDKEKSLLI